MKKFRWILLLLLLSTVLTAHPHMWFTSSFTFDTSASQLKGMWVEWIFDAFFTHSIVMDYDLNRDGVFDKAETQAIYDFAFINLAMYNYFLSIRQGDTRYDVDAVSDFSAYMVEDKLAYRFYVDLSFLESGEVYLAVYDPTFWCEITYPQGKEVTFRERNTRFRYRLEENPDKPVYYDPFGPINESPVHKEWKPGLQVFVPIEVHLWYE